MEPQLITLRDEAAGTSADVLAGFGFNCFRFTAAAGGEPVEVLYAEEGFASGARRPSGSGIPLLFPFPGRIRGTEFEFEGKRYELEPGDPLGNAIHGFVHERPWRVAEQADAKVLGEFQASADAPELLDRWPADFRLRAEYRLQGNRLAFELRVDNPDDRPLPFGFGAHPYFRVPLGAAGRADACVVRVPAADRWELSDMLPTGRRLPLGADEALSGGLEFGRMQFDDVLSGLESADGRVTASIRDPENGRALKIVFDDLFRECVVYNPPHREAVCIEPYTCVPGALELMAQGIDAGLGVLAPGETFAARIDYVVEAGA